MHDQHTSVVLGEHVPEKGRAAVDRRPGNAVRVAEMNTRVHCTNIQPCTAFKKNGVPSSSRVRQGPRSSGASAAGAAQEVAPACRVELAWDANERWPILMRSSRQTITIPARRIYERRARGRSAGQTPALRTRQPDQVGGGSP